MLTLAGIDQFYGESHTLWGLSLDVPKGSCTCLMGRNGVGKTTTLKCIMGLLPFRAGEIRLGGEGDVVHPDLAAAQIQQAHDALQRRRLADAVPSHEARARALGDVEGEVPERVALAVELIDGTQAQHAQAPR